MPSIRETVPFLLAALFLPALLAPTSAAADEVHLDNGDRLTGTVVSLADDELTLETAWGGTLTVDWGRVVAVVSDAPMTVVLEDGLRASGTLRPEAGGGGVLLEVEGESPPRQLDLRQITEINPPEEPAVQLKGAAHLGFVVSRGNAETRSTYLEASSEARSGFNRYSLRGSHKQVETNGTLSADRSTAGFAYDRLTNGPWYFTATADATWDDFQDLDLRTAVGASAGLRLWKEQDGTLDLELGVSYLQEDFLSAEDLEFPAARWSLELERALPMGNVTAFHTQLALLNLDNTRDLLLETKTGFRFRLFGRLVATTQVHYQNDRVPAPGREREDLTYLVNLGFEW